MKTNEKFEFIKQEEQYLDFLKKRLASQHFKESVSSEEFEKTKKKYDKAKLKMKMLKEGSWK